MTIVPTSVTFNYREILDRHDPAGKLATYFEILRGENEKLNLVSRETLSEGLEILAAESLLPLEHVEPSSFSSYLDIGSGGGLPAIPILLCRQIDQAILLERNSKKCLALGRIMRALSMETRAVSVEQGNLADVDLRGQFELITLRLVALTDKIGRKISHILSDSGSFAYYFKPPESFSCPALSGVTYRYQRDNDSSFKYFTIFQKSR